MLPLRARVDLETEQWRGILHSPKLQHYWSLTIRLFSDINRTLVGVYYPLCRDTVGVFCSTSRLGKVQECYELYWTNYGSNIPRNSSCTATSLPSLKSINKTNKKQGRTHKWRSPIDPYTLADQQELINNSAWTQDVARKTCLDLMTIYIYIYILTHGDQSINKVNFAV